MMRKGFRKVSVSFLLIVLSTLTIALSGCSSDKAGDSANNAQSTGAGTETVTSPETPAAETTDDLSKLTVGIPQDIDGLDPHNAKGAGTREVFYNIFEGLIKVDKDGNFVPAVAASYEITDGGLKYNFKLRENVKFHNGKVVTADDVIYSLKRAAGMLETSDPEVAIVSAFSIISEINKTDDGVQVVLSEPNTELIGFFTSSIIPCDYEGGRDRCASF